MNQQVRDSIIRKQASTVSPLKTHPSGYKRKMKPKERVTALSMHKERAARSKSLTDLAEPNQPRGGVEMCSRVLRPISWVPEIAGLPISRPSWFQPASKNRSEQSVSGFQYFHFQAQEKAGSVGACEEGENRRLTLATCEGLKGFPCSRHSTRLSMCPHREQKPNAKIHT